MRLGFFGSAAVGVPTFERLCDAHEMVLVVSQPDRPAGRGGGLRPTPLAQAARDRGLPVHQPERVGDPALEAMLREAAPDLVVVIAYGQLIPPTLLALPVHGFINLHASLLPRYRGAAPVPAAILAGETESGLTLFRLNERFDAGAVLVRHPMPIGPDTTTASLLADMGAVGPDLVLDTVARIGAGDLTPEPQIEAEATRAPNLAKADGRIDWSQDAAPIDRRVRACQPWPLAHTFLPGGKGRRLVVLATAPAEGRGAPGTVLSTEAGLVVATGDGALRLTQVKPEGKRAMADTDFLRGARIAPGDRLDPDRAGA